MGLQDGSPDRALHALPPLLRPTGTLKLTADNTPYVDGTYSAGLTLAKVVSESWHLERPEEAPLLALPLLSQRNSHPVPEGSPSLTFDLRIGRPIGRDELFREDVAPEEIVGVLFPYEIAGSRKPRGTQKAADSPGREEQCAAGHIEGAVSIPFAELAKRVAELPPARRVVANCRGPYCVFAAEAVKLLRKGGVDARRLKEGYPERRDAGLPVESPIELLRH